MGNQAKSKLRLTTWGPLPPYLSKGCGEREGEGNGGGEGSRV